VLGFGFLSVAVTAFGRELLSLLTQPEYASARSAIAPLALGAVAFATIQVTSAAISLRHKTGYIAAVSAAGAGVNLALNLAFVPVWGMRASAWATAVTALLLTVAYGTISHRLWRVRYETRRLAAIAAATVGFTVGAQALPDLALVAAIPVQAGYCTAYVLALLSLGAIDRRETRAARSVLGGIPLLRPRRS
jgi:O-antigen/teichoic acid export membrane protein